MKTIHQHYISQTTSARSLVLPLMFLAFVLVSNPCVAGSRALPDTPLPTDLISIAPSDVPQNDVVIYPMSVWPVLLPYPPNCASFPGCPLYYSASLGTGVIFVDDSALPATGAGGSQAQDDPLMPPGRR